MMRPGMRPPFPPRGPDPFMHGPRPGMGPSPDHGPGFGPRPRFPMGPNGPHPGPMPGPPDGHMPGPPSRCNICIDPPLPSREAKRFTELTDYFLLDTAVVIVANCMWHNSEENFQEPQSRSKSAEVERVTLATISKATKFY